jgi:hypothetical protein
MEERVDVTLIFWIYIREIFGSNLEPGHRTSRMRFYTVFFSSFRQIPWAESELGNDYILLYPFEFIFHPTIRRSKVWITDSVAK